MDRSHSTNLFRLISPETCGKEYNYAHWTPEKDVRTFLVCGVSLWDKNPGTVVSSYGYRRV
jgi:hypothetical protein